MNLPNPSDLPHLTTLGLNLTRSFKYVYDTQGVTKEELVWILHGILGQVLSWDEKNTNVLGEEDFPMDGRGYDSYDDGED